MSSQEPIRFQNPEEAQSKVKSWVRTTWTSHTPPRQHLVFQLVGVLGPLPGVIYLLEVLNPNTKEVIQIPLDYPLIHISESEAMARIDAYRQAQEGRKSEASLKAKISEVRKNQELKESEGVARPNLEPPSVSLPSLPKATPPPRRRVTATSLIRQMVKEGADKETIYAKLHEIYPDRPKAKLMQLIHCVFHATRKAMRAYEDTVSKNSEESTEKEA